MLNDMDLIGPVEIILPGYMNHLSKDQIQKLKESGHKNIIMACGYHKSSDNIVFFNESASLFEISVKKLFGNDIKILSAAPAENGDKVEILSESSIIEVDSHDLLLSGSAVNMSKFEIDISK
jgi:hypothetical protein